MGYSDFNIIAYNNISNNSMGIEIQQISNNNTIYHNSIVSNTVQAGGSHVSGSINTWDEGYPSGGNNWSDFTGNDTFSGPYQNETGSDGIGDISYPIDSNNTDRYPLMGMFNSYNVTYSPPPLVSHACNVTVISNSTISDFAPLIWIEHPEVIILEFNATGEQGSTGFCRVSFPTAMMNGTYHVSVNGTEIPYTLLQCSDANYSYLYFTYTHSTEGVIITPEFPSFLILPIFMFATLSAVILYKRKREKRSSTCAS